MKLYTYDNYKDIYPELKNSELTDALILRALVEHGFDDKDVRVYRDNKGKPLVDSAQGKTIHVSCSHSQDTFGCLVSEVNCGLDIQEVRQVNVIQIAGRYFTDGEQQYVADHGSEGFFHIWTRREAYAKYTGAGLRQVMSDVSVIGRTDVTFEDSILDNGMYCSICY